MERDAVTIRTAGPDDLPRLMDLYQHLIPGDLRPGPFQAAEILQDFLRYRGSALFVAETGGELVASCALVVIPNLTRGGQPYGLIENVVTHADFRRRGIGKAILDHATAAAWESGCYKLMLLTGSQQPAVKRFYQDAGFEQSKTGFQKRRIARRAEV